MFMPRYLPVLVALGLGTLSPGPARPPASAARVVARRDPTFAVPDSAGALLSQVSCLAADSSGNLYLADYSLGAVLKFDRRGNYLGTLGRRGSGPGEFYTVLLLGLRGDSVWTMDPALNRVTFFPPGSRDARTVPFGPAAVPTYDDASARSRSGVPAAVLADGTLLLDQVVRDSLSPVGQYRERLLLRTTRTLEVIDTLSRAPMTRSAMIFVYRDGESHFTQPFSDDQLYAASRDGRSLVTVSRPAATRGGSATFTVTMWPQGQAGPVSRRIEYTPRRLSHRTVDSLVDLLAGVGERRDAPRTPITADSIRRQLYRPAYYPPVHDVKVGRDGTIWLNVVFGDGPANAAEWLQLSRHGFELQRVVLPLHFRLMEADRRMLWGVEGDTDDVPVVSRYLLPERPAAL